MSQQPRLPSLLPACGAAAPGSEASFYSNQAGFRRQAVQDPAKEVPAPAVHDILTLGGLQQQRDHSLPPPQALQLS